MVRLKRTTSVRADHSTIMVAGRWGTILIASAWPRWVREFTLEEARSVRPERPGGFQPLKHLTGEARCGINRQWIQ